MHITKRVYDWSDSELKYCRQLGVRHIIAILPEELNQAPWEFLDLLELRKRAESFGLEMAAIEAPPPALHRPILLASPNRDEAIAGFSKSVENMARAGIHTLCYGFALNPCWGRWRNGLSGGGRGDAGLISFDSQRIENAPPSEAGVVEHEELWERFAYFADRVVPGAEKVGVKLACHPDDPPAGSLRGAAQILSTVDGMQRLLDTVPSPSNGLLYCQGTVAEMGVDVIEATRHFLQQQKIFVVHFRNVQRQPSDGVKFDEVFIDEGDVDMAAAMQLYVAHSYQGLIDPDHAPVMETDTQFGRHRGYAFAIGYMTALKQVSENGRQPS